MNAVAKGAGMAGSEVRLLALLIYDVFVRCLKSGSLQREAFDSHEIMTGLDHALIIQDLWF